MKMRVVDQLHISSLGANTMKAGDEFEVSDDLGKSLEQRGLATRVAEAAPKLAENVAETAGNVESEVSVAVTKAESVTENKMEEQPANKSDKPKRKPARR